MIDNSQFLDGVNRKEDTAWEELYRYYYAPLCSYAARITKDQDAAEDIVQNGFVRLWNSSSRFTNMRAITTYMYRFAYNGALNFIRDKKSSRAIHQVWTAHQQMNEERGVEMALEEETIARFYDIMSELSAQQREILLSCLEGATVKEIAEKLSISENTVKTQKKRAYQMMRERLDGLFKFILFLLFTRE
ncbi:sigma-70 family RNA polymerase sigma factor [uncultured Sanguibacteroides sp.]|uniref:RNA polymerase sigma factor n=1 Tax=uncultured Sanguibacteroides sp. TaxID=1635151 RepID=UPI0025D906DB|nr:sigma-70 family RNA polymerase sigma factor [uncultured Sanguibacteroides sp.]